MRGKILFLMVLVCFGFAFSQTAADYTFSTNTGDPLFVLTSPTTINSAPNDDTGQPSVSIGFSFNYCGNLYSEFSVTPDGFAVLGASAFTCSNDYSNVITGPVAANTTMLFPWWDDLALGASGNGGYINTELIGTAPNRVRVIEWFVTMPRSTTGTPGSTFQLCLYETSNVIQFRYGNATGTTTTASVGILNNIGGLTYQSVSVASHTASTTTTNNSNTGFDTNLAGTDRSYTFTPPSCLSPAALNIDSIAYDWCGISWVADTLVQYEYGPTGFTLGTGTLGTTNNQSIVLTGLMESTAYQFYIRQICANGDTSNWASPLSFTTPNSCPVPTALGDSALTESSATLYWTTGGASNWILEYGPAGFTQGSGTTLSVSTTSSTMLTGLMSATQYDWYVRDMCVAGDSSFWVQGPSFRTLIAPLACSVGTGAPLIVYTEDFETNPIGSSWTKFRTTNPMWTWDGAGGTTSTGTGPDAAYSGTGFLYLETSGGVTGDTDTLTSSTFDLNGVNAPARLRFFYHMYGPTTGDLSVQTSADGGTTWTPGLTISGQQQTSGSDPWVEAAVDLTSAVGSSNFMVRFIASRGTSFTGDIAIDLVRIEACVTCIPPSNVMVASNAPDSILVSFNSFVSANLTHIEYGLSGFTPGSGTTVSTAFDSVYLSGLTPDTDYDVYVFSDCSLSTMDSSLVDGPYAVTTQISCYQPTMVSVDSLTDTYALITFSDSLSNLGWELEYGLDGFAPGTGTLVSSMDTFFELSGLNPASDYDFYVRSVCAANDSSVWTSMLSFTTLCPVYVPYYTTNFNIFPPTCWDEASDGTPTTGGPTNFGTGDWIRRTTFNSAGSAALNLFNTGTSDWLVSPEFDLSGSGVYQVTIETAVTEFFSANPDAAGMTGTDDEVQLVYSTDGGITWTVITTWNAANQPDVSGTTETFVLFGVNASNVQFGVWASEGTVDDNPDYDFHVNSFTVELAPLSDVGVTEIIEPVAGCGMENTPFTITVENFGIEDQYYVPVVVEITGDFAGYFSYVIDTLPALTTTTFTIDSLNTLAGGVANIAAFTAQSTDENTSNDAMNTTVEFGVVPVTPAISNMETCMGSSVTLNATTNVNWYLASTDSLLATDSTLTVSPSMDTWYSYEAIVSTNLNVGATSAPTTGFTTTPDWGLRFHANSDFTLNTVTLYPSGTGMIDIAILDDATETVLMSTGMQPISDGGTAYSPVVFPLNFDIPANTGDYRIVMSSFTGLTSLGREFGLSFPFSTPGGEVEILYGSTGAANSTSTSYYWFYNWDVTIAGCTGMRDSVMVSVNPTYNDTLTVSACDSMMIAGINQTMSGFYTDSLMSASGCDSIVVYNLTINNSTSGAMSDVFCAGSTYTLPDGSTVSAAGTYVVVLTNAAGCDSLLSVTLNELMPASSTMSATICSNGTYTLPDGMIVTDAGTYTSTLSGAAANGCDSVVTTTVSVVNTFSVSQNVQICANDTLVVGTSSYTATGTYTDTLMSVAGCDSIVTTNLVVFPASNVSIGGVSTICENAGTIDLSLSPVGGTLSGDGVTGTSFDPAAAGVGTHVLTYTYSDDNGCNASASLEVEVILCTGIKDISGIETIAIFPNPYSEVINLQFEDKDAGDLNIKLFDITGRLVVSETVQTQTGDNTIALRVPEFAAAGVSIIQIERDGNTYQQTLIKK